MPCWTSRISPGEIATTSARSRPSSLTPRIDPLYSLAAAALALRLPAAERHANIAGVDLMDAFAPGLSRRPYDRPRYGEAWAKVRPVPDIIPFTTSGTPELDGRRHLPPVNAAKVRLPKVSAEDKAVASRLSMPPRLAAQFPVIRQGLTRLTTPYRTVSIDTRLQRGGHRDPPAADTEQPDAVQGGA